MNAHQPIVLKELTVRDQQSGKLILDRVSCTIKPGEKVLIVGPSGAGKSTLLQVIAKLLETTNQFEVNADLYQVPPCSYVFQDPDSQFCMPYVDEELAFMLENQQVASEDMLAIIKRMLTTVGLQKDQPHTAIQTLSMGMKQRLALASAMLHDKECMLLDEPSALLDPDGAVQLWNEVAKHAEGKTVVAVEHRITEALPHMDRVLLFNHRGQLVADSKASVFFNEYRKEVIAAGIWHPHSWEDYAREKTVTRRFKQPKEVLALNDWQLLRRKKPLVTVKEATVYENDWICITGVNGAGKSSLLYGLMNLLHHKGQYTLNGELVHRKEHVSDRINFVFQHPEFQFVTTNVEEELLFSATNADEKALVKTILQRFGLSEYCTVHPYRLSVGQKRRLSVATAFVHSKPFLFLDEPTFGQDAYHTFALLDLMEDFRQSGGTIVMVTHDKTLVRLFATQEWHVKNGALIPSERRQLEGVLAT
ncbi:MULTISPECIES: ABC transporter ATP-binding protein [Bacillaceae]|uniref:ABC transporter domain-containing protein n=1 Tax=Alkalicoccobacillus plakortidis TaxID=444060 RepID=A0A9D5DTM0_9BACI|nr:MULTISPECIES: ABC transporter ATP-binding protein [Bacillaceae]KQL57826.1 hypothetical protein AN965_05735 [Alkalicoccobacillus plakortidis]